MNSLILKLYGLFHALKATQLYTIGVKELVIEMDAKFIKGMLNNPMLHPNDAVNQWIATILLFNFELMHVPTEKHTRADGLSQCPLADNDDSPDNTDELESWIDSNASLFIEFHNPPWSCNPTPHLLLSLS